MENQVFALTLPNGEHAVLTWTYQTDGKGAEAHLRNLVTGRTDALFTIKIGSDPALLIIPNINTTATGIETDGGVLGILGYTKD